MAPFPSLPPSLLRASPRLAPFSHSLFPPTPKPSPPIPEAVWWSDNTCNGALRAVRRSRRPSGQGSSFQPDAASSGGGGARWRPSPPSPLFPPTANPRAFAPVSSERVRAKPSFGVPDARGAVGGAGGQEAAGRVDVHARDRAAVPLVRPERTARLHVPGAHRQRPRRHKRRAAIRRDRQSGHRLRVAGKRLRHLPRVQRDNLKTGRGGKRQAPVRRARRRPKGKRRRMPAQIAPRIARTHAAGKRSATRPVRAAPCATCPPRHACRPRPSLPARPRPPAPAVSLRSRPLDRSPSPQDRPRVGGRIAKRIAVRRAFAFPSRRAPGKGRTLTSSPHAHATRVSSGRTAIGPPE